MPSPGTSPILCPGSGQLRFCVSVAEIVCMSCGRDFSPLDKVETSASDEGVIYMGRVPAHLSREATESTKPLKIRG